MKNTLFLIPLIFSLNVVAQTNALLPKKLVMYDKILFDSISEDMSNDLDFKFRASLYIKSQTFNEIDYKNIIVKNLSEGRVLAYSDYEFYNYSGHFSGTADKLPQENNRTIPISLDELKSGMGYSIDSVYVFDEEIGEGKIVEVVNEIDKNSIQGFIFYDEWIFDEANFKMFKNVMAYSPVRAYYPDDYQYYIPYYRPIGYIIQADFQNENEKKSTEKNMKHFKRIEYEFFIDNVDMYQAKPEFGKELTEICEKENSPMWNSYTKSKFRNLILERVLSEKSEAFDFETGKKLSTDEIRQRAGERIDTLYIDDFEGFISEVEVKTEIANIVNEIKSIIFIEDWYIDENTLRIKKIVNGIVPIRWYDDTEDEESEKLVKKNLFVVYFNQ